MQSWGRASKPSSCLLCSGPQQASGHLLAQATRQLPFPLLSASNSFIYSVDIFSWPASTANHNSIKNISCLLRYFCILSSRPPGLEWRGEDKQLSVPFALDFPSFCFSLFQQGSSLATCLLLCLFSGPASGLYLFPGSIYTLLS